jgi:hypothetical protein
MKCSNARANPSSAVKIKNVALVLAASLSLAPFTYLSVWGSSGLTVYSPAALLAFFPLYILPQWLALFTPSLLFILWNGCLLRKDVAVPVRTSVVFLLLSALTVFYFVIGWSAGIEYNGAEYTRSVCVINVLMMGLLGLLWLVALKAKNYWANFIFSWVLFLWLSWQAFPYLGEH